eukprot:TRINITY_DN7821_c0_g1_i1.p1 TRINITY_DN7821_c0_g1~~TRINITY_DN7821_c0_g1_i1.p1  ORF type:complete len:412 (+),score=94.92 TRINITY_DN7821_c0_g1_i1:41-1276(+)
MAPQKRPAAAKAKMATKKIKAALKRKSTSAAPGRKPAAAQTLKRPAQAQNSSAVKKRRAVETPKELEGLYGYVVSLERRPDRWKRVQTMLEKETPWLQFEKLPASDGTRQVIPEREVAKVWNTKYNAGFADFYEWVFDKPRNKLNGQIWMWAADAPDEDDEWQFSEDSDEPFNITKAATFKEDPPRTGTLVKKATGEVFKVKLRFADRYKKPGQKQIMSGGERGCAHSHRRVWQAAAERKEHTLVLEDDAQIVFERTDAKLGKMNGKKFTERLVLAMKYAPKDFDVIYLGWSGWRGGNFMNFKDSPKKPVGHEYIRKAEYVWTTVAYVISQSGARKLLKAATPINQPVDNFMAWEASAQRLKSFVAIDAGDQDDTWAGGIVDQFDFQGDSDIKKSDGGHQGDDLTQFVASK